MKLAATGAISLLRSTKTHHVVVRMKISSLNCVPGSNIRPIDAGGLMVTKKQMQEGWNDDESAYESLSLILASSYIHLIF